LFIELACRIAASVGASHDEIRDAASRVIRYFSQSLPLHVADEEESIVPRLSGRDTELDAAMQNMQQEHDDHGMDLESLLRICRVLEKSPERLPELREELRSTASVLQEKFVIHLEQEERIVLPAIRTLLTPADLEAMLRELSASRS
jgi:iron-sulfur cluster repair protein YtfE (RIC family)